MRLALLYEPSRGGWEKPGQEDGAAPFVLHRSQVERIVVVSYRPNPGKRDELLRLLEAQHRRGREIGLLRNSRPFWPKGSTGKSSTS